MSKTAKDWIINRARELAKEDSQGAGGWGAIEDLANMKLAVNPDPYIQLATLYYFDTLPAPTPAQEVGDE